MKRIIPLKYFISIIIFTMILPVSIAVLLIILLENESYLIIAIIMFLFFCPFMGIVIILQNDVNIIINEFSTEVTNNIIYNSDSYNWTRDLKKLKEIYYTNKKNEIYKVIRRKHIPHKLLVFVFNNQEIKCIPLDLFTKKQINKIIKTIDKIKRDI